MSDNEGKLQKLHSNLRLIRRILAIVLVVLVVCSAVLLFLFRDELNMDALRRWVKYLNIRGDESFGTYTFDAHNSNRYANFDGGLAVASVGGISTYQEDGRQVAVSQSQLSLPEIQIGRELVLAYDVGGTSLLAVHSSGSEVLRVTSEKPILDADISGGDDICYVSSAAGYKSVLTVYNEKQEKIYRWLSSSTYMPLCAVSDNGTDLAAVGLDQKSGSFVSTLNLFRTTEEQICATVSLGNELIYDLMYLGEDMVCAIGELSVQYYSAAGEPMAAYRYDGQYLKDYDCGGDGFLTLSLNMYRAGNRYTLVTLDEAGEELGSVRFTE